MTPARLAVVCGATAVMAAGCGACEPRHDAADGAASSSGALPSSSHSPAASTRPPILAKPPRLACRAIAVDGDVHLETGQDAGTTPLLLQGLVPTEAWLDLGAGARFVAKDPRTTRETIVHGPGRARACVGYSEETWITAGAFESSPGAGESPGAEEWVAAPLAVVRYVAAKLQVEVRPKATKVSILSGTAFAWPADDATAKLADGGVPARTDDGWIRLEGAVLDVTAAPPAPTPTDAARAAVTKCEEASKAAHDLTSAVMSGTADASVVRDQVTARRLARAACAAAIVRVSTLAPQGDATALAASVASANATWSSLAP